MHLVDLLVVAKDEDGKVTQVELSDVPELQEYGAVAGALMGFGAAGEAGAEAGAIAGAEATADGEHVRPRAGLGPRRSIPPGMTAAIAMLEHRWAIPMRDAVEDAGGVVLADEWIHPEDLVRYGAEAAVDEDRRAAGPRTGKNRWRRLRAAGHRRLRPGLRPS